MAPKTALLNALITKVDQIRLNLFSITENHDRWAILTWTFDTWLSMI